jgi:hypothetical protein
MDADELRAQNLARQMANSQASPPPVSGLSPSFGQCSQCGMFHPPVRPGEICPLKPLTVKTADGTNQQVEVEKYLVTMKTILVSQLGKKTIKDPKKFFQNMIIELTKYIEGYKE